MACTKEDMLETFANMTVTEIVDLISAIEEKFGVTAAVAVAAGGAAQSPDDVIAKYCGACHMSGLLGAPKIGDAAAWKTRASAKGGVDGLLKSAIAGLNAMPPKGTCATCSDDELKAAIKVMSGL